MSLINEALKKAQRDRSVSDGPAAGSGPGSTASPTRGNRGSPSWTTVLLILVGGSVLVAVSVFGTVYLLRKPVSSIAIQPEQRALPATASANAATPANATTEATSTSTVAQPPAARAESPPAPQPTSPPAPPATSATEPRLTFKAPNAPPPPHAAGTAAPNSSSPPATTVASVTPTAAPPPAVSAPPAPATPARPAPPNTTESPRTAAPPSAAAQAFVDQVRVTGIRASGNESKVLMNDRVYRLHDLVDRTLGLRLTEVGADRLVFTDASGNTYVRNF